MSDKTTGHSEDTVYVECAACGQMNPEQATKCENCGHCLRCEA